MNTLMLAASSWNASLVLLLAKATIILIAALGITLSMQKASATARHLVWLVTLVMLLTVPAMTAWGPLEVAVLPAASNVERRAATLRDNSSSVQLPPPAASGAPHDVSFSTKERTSSPGVSARFLASVESLSGISLIIAVWAVVAAAILVSLAWAGLTVRRIVRRAQPLVSPDWQGPLFEIADRLGLDEAPRLLESSDAKMPFACGVVMPTIVLPAEAQQWSLERRRAVLLHELAHVRRHDLIGHTLGRLACAAYWFHPLVWTAAKRLRSESERACDDLALACGTRATDYAEHLLDIVTSVRGDSTPLVALAMARRKEFEGRMLAILDPDLRHSAPSRRQSAALIGALAMVSLVVGAISPVARQANAATVATAPRARQAEAPSIAAAPRRPAYPDSGVRGVSSSVYAKHTDTSMVVNTVTSTQQSQSVNTVINDAVRSLPLRIETGNPTLNVIANASAHIGLDAAAIALNRMDKGEKGDKGDKGSKSTSADDRANLLAKVLKSDSSASLRRIAAWGLQEYADTPVGSDALVQAVRHDSNEAVREMAAWSLAEGSDRNTAVTSALVYALKSDASTRVRATAAWALGNSGNQDAVDGLTAALSDANSSVRMRAAWALGNVEPRTAPKPLIAMLSDKEVRVRELAAWALFNIGDASAVPALEAALKGEQDTNAQMAYIKALAAMGEKSVTALSGLIESKDPRVKDMAVRALAGGHAAGPWPWPWPEPRPQP